MGQLLAIYQTEGDVTGKQSFLGSSTLLSPDDLADFVCPRLNSAHDA